MTVTEQIKVKYLSFGFTLIELAVIVVIIGILTIVTINSYNKIIDKLIFSTAKSNLSSLQRAVWLYYNMEGHYPENLSLLVSSGYISKIPLLNIKYHIPTQNVIVSSQPYTPNVDTGEWYYNNVTGVVTIACTHKDIEGIEIYKW